MKKTVVLSLILFSALMSSAFLFSKNKKDISATVFKSPRVIIPFQLTDNHGNPFSNKNLKNHWSLLFFGFTHCPQMCPTALSTLNQVYKRLQAMNKSKDVNVIFISVDPARDTVKRVNEYINVFNKNFIGLTGDTRVIDKLTHQLGIALMKMQPKAKNDNDYNINHNGAILLINPKGAWVALFSYPQKVDQIVHDFLQIRT